MRRPIKLTSAPEGFEYYRVCDPEGVCQVVRGKQQAQRLIAEMPELMNLMYKQLNDTWRTVYSSRTPAALLGDCNQKCANQKWLGMGGSMDKGKPPGPICGVPGSRGNPPPPPSRKQRICRPSSTCSVRPKRRCSGRPRPM